MIRHFLFTILVLSAVAGCDRPIPAPAPPGTGSNRGIVKEIDPEFAEKAAPASKIASDSDRLLADLERTLRDLEQRQPALVDAIKQYRVELAQRLADLRSSLARSGQSLEEIRAVADAGSQTDPQILRIRRIDRRCSELRVYVSKLQSTRDNLRLLIEDHQYVISDLQTRKTVDKLIDPAVLQKARDLLDRAGDSNELSPKNILDNPELVVQMVEAEQQTAAAIAQHILPDRPEKTLTDFPALPTLDFKAEGDVEEFLLDDLRDHLAKGKEAAEQHLAANRPEAAIENLHEALKQIRVALDAYSKAKPAGLKWRDTCITQLETARVALSEQLAGPYLETVKSQLPLARKSGNWSGVLDLLEAVVRLAPGAKNLPEAIESLDTILKYRRNADDLDAAVAYERLQEIKAQNSGKPRAAVPFQPRPGTTQPAEELPPELQNAAAGQLHGIDLAPLQNAQNNLALACRRYLKQENAIKELLLKFKPAAPNVVAAEQERTAILDEVRGLVSARDEQEAAIFGQLERQIADRRSARDHLTNTIGLLETADDVRKIDAQINELQRSQTRFAAGNDRVAGKGAKLDLTNFVRDPQNLLIGMRNSVGMTLVPIAHGEYVMGTPANEEGHSDDEAQVKVTLPKDFYMAATETTIGQFLQFANDPAVTLQEDWIDLESEYCPIERRGNRYVLRGGSCKFGQSEEQPVVMISWLGADAFRKWLSKKEGREYRLPTEAEWEYCARAGTTTAYYWGNDLSPSDPYAWYGSNSGGATHPVAGKLPNAWGLYDMAGNCWEWTSDWYATERAGGTDPRGPSSGSARVFRGGSWGGADLRSGFRSGGSPEFRINYLGFRVAWSPSGTSERSR